MELFSYKFTDLLDFSSPSMEMLLAPAEILEFASTLAQQMLAAQPDLVDKGICVAVYDYQWSLSAPCINAALSRC